MCFFLVVTVQKARASAAAAALQALHWTWTPCASGQVVELPPEEVAAWAYHGQCACNDYTQPRDPRDLERQRAKYERSGWSRARIERALAQSQASTKPAGLSPDAQGAVLAVHAAAGTCGVLVHDARGNLAREEVRLASTRRIRPDEFGAAAQVLLLDHLLVLEETGGGTGSRDTRTRGRRLERGSGRVAAEATARASNHGVRRDEARAAACLIGGGAAALAARPARRGLQGRFSGGMAVAPGARRQEAAPCTSNSPASPRKPSRTPSRRRLRRITPS